VVTPFAKNLEKLGFVVNYKVIDFAVLQKRLDVFDFEIISNRNVGSESPGTELMERFGSKAAGTEGSGNFMGIQDSAVDALLEKVTSSKTRPQLITAVRALDRVLRHGHYAVPHWYGGVHRVAWRNGRFEQPAVTPRYYQPEGWAVSTWWATRDNQATLAAATRGQP
jgi:microcin C transport system substrate-binding protein